MDKIEMATQIGKANTHLKIFASYQNFLIDTWKSDDQRPAIYGDASTVDWSGNLWKELR